jgi:FKBP-type peptidyl-prolyl cis-trans isomerase
MMKNILWALVLVMVVGTAGASGEGGDTITTSSGLRYVITERGNGTRAEAGDKVVAHYTGKFSNGEIFDSSVQSGTPFTFNLGKGQVIKGWDEGFALLKEGDKATFIIPYQLAYGERGRPPQIPAKATLIFDVELLEVHEPVVAVPYEIEVERKFLIFFKKKEKLEEVTTESGLKYYVVHEGTGDMPNKGAKVVVHYTGYLEDGSTFDSSVERGQPFKFPIGQGRVIKGWDEGVAMMKTGGKRRFIIPPELGYGERGLNKIPANSTLIFDVELLNYENQPQH